ncbi:MAG: hypothetical protein AAF493_05300 [Pseudomonadota bacterium]
MRGLLAYSMRGRSQAVTVASVFAVLAPLLPPMSFLTGGIVGLATLRNGLKEGAIVVVGSVVLTGILLLIALGSPKPVVGFILVWVPILVFSELLRRSGGQNVPIAATGVLGAVAVVVVRMVLGDPTAWWTDTLTNLFSQFGGQAGVDFSGERAQRFIADLAPQMTGLLVASFVLSWIVTLLLARWWHAILDNPGGFSEEYRRLALSPRLAFLTIAVMVASFIPILEGLATDVLMVLIVVYTFQGIAVAHSLVHSRGASVSWLVVMYALLLLVQWPIVVFLAVVGLGETWLRFRTRFART